MSEAVEWRADGVARSARFDDIYHSETGAPEQARRVFMGGCGLPAAWAGMPQWRILETGFGLGVNFLTTWQAWRADPSRSTLLHFVSVEAFPVAAADLLRAAAPSPELMPLAEELAAQWHGLLPGVHRLAFDEGRVLLTLCVGDVQAMLRGQQRFDADSIYLDGFSPQRNPDMWSAHTLKAVARFARPGTRLATWTVARAVRDALAPLGFQLTMAPGMPPKRDSLRGVFAPTWTLRRKPSPDVATAAGECAVIGAGLAGAAVAAQLARRGWRVTVLDAADHPAAGASGLPAGVLAPHASPDDALLSRLTRAGVRATWQQATLLLDEGRDWWPGGVLERRAADTAHLPATWNVDGPNESWHASADQLALAALPTDTVALWHARAGWVRPARLVAAWLATPGVRLMGGRRVARMAAAGARWQLFDAHGALMAEVDRIVVAAGHESIALAPALPLSPVRGQIAWGAVPASAALPPMPLNGDGHLIAGVPDAQGNGSLWLSGATFERDSADSTPTLVDLAANRARLAQLHPGAAQALAGQFERGEVQAWAGIRCASADRRPLVGPIGEDVDAGGAFPIWACTAMGSRGLTFATLCAELLAAQWHGEPVPVEAALAKSVDTRRITVTRDMSGAALRSKN